MIDINSSAKMKNDITITLIGGSGRSGTTLLRKVLGKHIDVCEVPEWRVPVDPGGLIDFYTSLSGTWTPSVFDSRFKELKKILNRVGKNTIFARIYRRLIHRLALNKVCSRNLDIAYGQVDVSQFCPIFLELIKELENKLNLLKYQSFSTNSEFWDNGETALAGPFQQDVLQEILGGFYRQVVTEALNHTKCQHYLEKNTWYPLVFHKFIELVPEAKLIHIVRDPRDVVCSMMNQRWAPQELDTAVTYFQSIMHQWSFVKDQLPKESFIEVAYEELISDPEEILGRISRFAGIPVESGPYHLSKKSIGRWNSDLNDADKNRLNTLLELEVQQYMEIFNNN